MKKVLLIAVLVCSMMTTSVSAAASITTKPLWKAGGTVNKIIVISDLHLGVDDKISETVANRKYLVDFMKRIQQTKNIRELVIGGDFLDDWFLPLSYPTYSDPQAFYAKVISNNQMVFDELNKMMNKGIKVVYVPGNHDMLLKADTLIKALPKLTFVGADGLGAYITGDRNEIAIEHGNRYDIFSAPDTLDNKDITNGNILPPGYFYARIAASWVLQGKPPIKKNLPEITAVPSKEDIDQFGAYIYYLLWNGTLNRFTNIERFDDIVFDLKIAGFHGKYSVQDIYPVLQSDGTISSPLLYKNFQRTWEDRQRLNGVIAKSSFIESATAAATGDSTNYFPKQEELQYAGKGIDTVVFGHTHYPLIKKYDSGITVVNDGTWIDKNTSYPGEISRTFVAISTGKTTTAAVYTYDTDGKLYEITKGVALQK